jgi:hypothetical protein
MGSTATRVWLLRLGAYWFGLAILWGALTTVVIPTLVGARVPPEIKGSAVALVAAMQALVAGLGYRAIFVLAAIEFGLGAWAVTHVPEPGSTTALPREVAPEG